MNVIGIAEDGSCYQDCAIFALEDEQEKSYVHVPKNNGRHVIGELLRLVRQIGGKK